MIKMTKKKMYERASYYSILGH